MCRSRLRWRESTSIVATTRPRSRYWTRRHPLTGAGADFHALRGAVLQRLSRQAEAADAYRRRWPPESQSGAPGSAWVFRWKPWIDRPEAAEAYRRGIATGLLTADLLAYAEQRAQQLR